MQQVQNINLENIPKNRYVIQKDKSTEEFYKNESHIHKQGLLSGVKAELHKYYNDIFTYFPKGFSGSKNSDFYEFLSLGKIPNLIGSVMLIGLYSFANNKFDVDKAAKANSVAKNFGAGVVLYALFKWASKKIAHKGIKLSTGADIEQRYIDKKNELPEPGQSKGLVRIEYRQTLESMEFPRVDLWRKKGEIEHDDQDAEYKKIAEKNGWGKDLNAVNQIVVPKLRQLKARTTALENITSYIAAATGVALGSTKPFENMRFQNFLSPINFSTKQLFKYIKDTIKKQPNDNDLKSIGKSFVSASKQSFEISKSNAKEILRLITQAPVELWNGTNRNIFTKHFGKALLLGTVITTALTWLIPTLGFKSAPNPIKSKIDNTKEYEVG